jgi:multidrug efflux pump subunit AcrA (membrane-fusion protein)
MANRSKNLQILAAVGLLAMSLSAACARFASPSSASDNTPPAAEIAAQPTPDPTPSSRIGGVNTVPVKRDDVVDTVTLDGVVVPTSQETITYPRQGQVDSVQVKTGQVLKQGDPVLDLQSTDVQRSLDGARDHLDTSKAALAQGQAQADAAQKAAADQAVVNAQHQQDQVAALQVRLQQAQENLVAVQAGKSLNDRDSATTAVDKGQALLLSAQADRDKLMAGPSDDDLRAAQRDLSAKQTALAQAQSDLNALTNGADAGAVRAAEATLQRAQTQLQLAQTSKLDPKQDHATAQLQHDLAIQDAQAAVVSGQSALDQLKEPPTQLGVMTAKQKVIDAQTAADAAQTRLDTMKAGPDSAAVAAADSAIASAQHYLAEAQQGAAEVLSHPTPAELAAAQQEVHQAQLDLDDARQGQPTAAGPAGPDLDALQAAVDKDMQAVAKLEQQLQDTHLTAPFDGTVISVKIKASDTLNSSKPVMVLAHTGTPLVRADVDDSIAPRIIAGQHAAIDAGSGGSPADAVISTVEGASTTGTSANLDVTWPGGVAPKFGTPVTATVTLNEKQDVLVVPKSAVRKLGTRSTVEVQDGTVRHMVNVEVGIVTADTAEIVSGLSEGQLVVTPTATR